MKRCFALVLLLAVPVFCRAQADQTTNPSGAQRGDHRGFMREGQGIAGTIGEMKSDSFTIKTMQGKTVTVKVTAQTRFRKEGQPAKLSDFKPGDMVVVAGEAAGGDTWTARFVGSRAQMNLQALREGMGKQFIAGEVKAIDGTKLTIVRPDGQTQTIEVDENTSFRNGRESITLPDIKVGDRVFGRGQLNAAGVFVPKTLNIGGMWMMREAPGAATPPR